MIVRQLAYNLKEDGYTPKDSEYTLHASDGPDLRTDLLAPLCNLRRRHSKVRNLDRGFHVALWAQLLLRADGEDGKQHVNDYYPIRWAAIRRKGI
jgi:hypothetical protein